MEDQAAGLRRLFAPAREAAHIAVAGDGRAALVAGLARGLAGAGKEVVVVDEHGGGEGAAAAFGLAPRFDLLQAANGDVAAARVVQRPEAAIRVVPAARAARACARDATAQRRVAEWLRRMLAGADVVLLDAAACGGGGASALLPAVERVVLVAGASGRGLTEAYAQLKRLAPGCAGCTFEVVVARAAGAQEAAQVFANLHEVARRHLGIGLELLGSLPLRGDPQAACDALADALLRGRRAPRGGGRSGGIVLGQMPLAMTAT